MPKLVGWGCIVRKNVLDVCSVGWSDLKKLFDTFYVVPNCCRPPIPKFHILMLPFSLLQGIRKYCYPKNIRKHKKNFLKPATGGIALFDFFFKCPEQKTFSAFTAKICPACVLFKYRDKK